jgi:hypothetical protein
MLAKLIAFFKSRPTETWLGLWVAIVAVFVALDIQLPEGLEAAVSAAVAWLVTFFASKTNLGPSPTQGE